LSLVLDLLELSSGWELLEMLDHLERMEDKWHKHCHRPMAPLNPDGTPGEAVQQPPPAPRRKYRSVEKFRRLKMVMISGLQWRCNSTDHVALQARKQRERRKKAPRRIANVLRLRRCRGRGN